MAKAGGGGVMRSVIVLLSVMVFSPGVVFAKSLYVSGYREVGVRTTPDSEGAIMVTLKTGDEVTLVNSTGEYYLVSLPGGSRGYVQKTAMTDQEPAEVRLQKLDQKTQQQIKELQTKTEEQERQLAALRQDRGQLDTARKQAEMKAGEQAKRATELEAQQDAIVRDFYIQWFLAGAGVLGAGFLLGWIWRGIVQRSSRRPGLSLGR
jgi:SH3 domain protein